MPDHVETIVRLLIALVLGGLIGLERELHRRPAGLRTHILVCIGSALIMILSVRGFEGAWPNRDPARLAAQVVSGIGFLGAGTILREGATVIGLTTAASLWVVAGIGLATGLGVYFEAAFTAVLAFITLFLLDRFERRIVFSKRDMLSVKVADKPGVLGSIAGLLGRHGASIKEINLETQDGSGEAFLEFSIDMPRGASWERVLEDVARLEDVRSVRREAPR